MPMPAPSVVLHDGRPATTSLEIAKFFGKRHTDVLRDINNILPNCPEKFSQRNFASANYLDDQAKNRPMFIIFKDGFMLLVMGYTGKKALVIKLAYIEAFNALEAELQRQREGALPPADALAPSQQAQLKALVDAKVGMLPKEHQRKGYGEVWSRFARHFEIAKYTQLPPERMSEAVEYLIELELKVAEPALPAPSRIFTDRVSALTDLENRFMEFAGETRSRLSELNAEYIRLNQGAYAAMLGMIPAIQPGAKDRLIDALAVQSYDAYNWIDAGLSRMRLAIVSARAANSTIAGGRG